MLHELQAGQNEIIYYKVISLSGFMKSIDEKRAKNIKNVIAANFTISEEV